jgi:hypothetical protein
VYDNLFAAYCGGRRLFETYNGFIGLGPQAVKQDDVVAVQDGGKVPHALRPLGRKAGYTYAFVGEAYVYDIMRGEVYDMCGKKGVKEQEFVLR